MTEGDWTAFWDAQRTFSMRFLRHNFELFLARSTPLLRLDGSDAVLDLGCGPGFGARALSSRVSEYCGVDASPRALTECASVAAELGNVRFAQIDLAREAVPRARRPAGYTVILAHSTLHYLPSRTAVHRVVSALSELAAPGARLLIADVPCGSSLALDALSQLWHGARGGYLTDVVRAVVSAAVGDYAGMRRARGVLSFSTAQLLELGACFGKEVQVIQGRLTANASRMHVFARR